MTIQMKAHSSHFEDLLKKEESDTQTSNARNGWLMTVKRLSNFWGCGKC
jgi:hypothetical protein